MAAPLFHNITPVKEGSRKMQFEVRNVSLSVVNAIRRIILSEIPNVAIAFDPYNESENDIKFISNTTSLHNEFMGHRLSLVPINLSLDDIRKYENNHYKFVIDVKNETAETIPVTTKDIRVFDSNGTQLPESSRNVLFPPCPITNDYILLTKLKANPFNKKDGEHLHCEMFARKSIAKNHARWSHVSLCSFHNKVDDDAANKGLDEMMAKLDDSLTDEERNRAINRFNTIERNRFFMKNEYDEPSHFIFEIEMINDRILPSELFTKAIDVLSSKVISLTEPDKIEYHRLSETDNLYLLKIKNEGHTIGNLFQSMVYDMYVRDTKLLTYVGYYQPHPLENDIVVKIRCDTFTSVDDAKRFIEQVVDGVSNYLRTVRNEWTTRNNITLQVTPQKNVEKQTLTTKKVITKKKK